MPSISGDISSWFWSPSIWLPPNITWENFKEPSVLNNTVIQPKDYAIFSDLWYPIPMAMAFMLMILRWVVERLVFRPVGKLLGLKDNRQIFPEENKGLEKALRISCNITTKEVTKVPRYTGFTIFQVACVKLTYLVTSTEIIIHHFLRVRQNWVNSI